jgi:hypothetical protein
VPEAEEVHRSKKDLFDHNLQAQQAASFAR